MKNHIHIFGASGSGTTTIAKSVSKQINYSHFDSDNYFWSPTTNPFTVERDKTECIELMKKDLYSVGDWILSGSVTGWGDELLPLFDLVIFVYVPTEKRIERLKKREAERYGDRILPTGDRHKESMEFIEWASAYDFGTRNGRSLPKHEMWLKKVDYPVIKIENIVLNESVDKVIKAVQA